MNITQEGEDQASALDSSNKKGSLAGCTTRVVLLEAALEDCYKALNEIPNHALKDDRFESTYGLAVKLQKLLNK